MVLEIRPNCQNCGKPVAAGSAKVYICSFERTYCANCAENKLNLKCDGCGGALVQRPVRSRALLAKYPAANRNGHKGPKTKKIKP